MSFLEADFLEDMVGGGDTLDERQFAGEFMNLIEADKAGTEAMLAKSGDAFSTAAGLTKVKAPAKDSGTAIKDVSGRPKKDPIKVSPLSAADLDPFRCVEGALC